jgi:formate hydrogenlyase subunit 3/multisubunit Na+/H+ antiporter MnhD subunit
MDPATFHVLCNFKILTTALLYRVMLRRVISARRWLALTILGLGSALAAYSAIEGETAQGKHDKENSPSELHVTFTGLLVLAVYCIVSGFAGVYTEKIMRKQMQTSIFEQGERTRRAEAPLGSTFLFLVDLPNVRGMHARVHTHTHTHTHTLTHSLTHSHSYTAA